MLIKAKHGNKYEQCNKLTRILEQCHFLFRLLYFCLPGSSASVGLTRSWICAWSLNICASLAVAVQANAGMAFPFTQTALVWRVPRGCPPTVFPPSTSGLSCFPLLGLRSGESFAYLLSPLVSVDGRVLPPIDINVQWLQVSFAPVSTCFSRWPGPPTYRHQYPLTPGIFCSCLHLFQLMTRSSHLSTSMSTDFRCLLLLSSHVSVDGQVLPPIDINMHLLRTFLKWRCGRSHALLPLASSP